jgi:hypothetical protein
MKEQWIQEMRQKMADYRRTAPEVSWEEIERAMTANKTRKTRRLWLQRVAAAAAILLIGGVGYWSFMHHETEQVAVNHEVEQSVENHGEDREGWQDDGNVTKIKVPVQAILGKGSSPVISSAHKTDEVVLLAKGSETDVPVSESSSETVSVSDTTEQEQPRVVEERTQAIGPTNHTAYPTVPHQRKRIDNHLTAKVYMSSSMSGSNTASSNLYGIGGLGNYLAFTQAEQIEQHIHHRQPVRFGLSLRYRLTDRWSIESGLLYTHLSSDITTTVDHVTTVTEQRLNYIGLPLNISYDLWKNRSFGLYVTTGGTIEKQLEASPWQFSINGAAGAEYKFMDNLSLYAEPGLGYYFKDGSNTPTIYQDHPLNFNLSFGLRFNLK